MKGTIRVRENRDGSKSYVCQIKLGRDPGTGKARVLTGTARSERTAHRLLHELIVKAEDRSQHASDASLATVIEQWLATGGPAGEATRQVYAGYIRLHVLPELGDVPLRNLGVADLERWYASLREKGLSPASIRKAHTIVRAALAHAVWWGWAPTNVAALARPPLMCSVTPSMAAAFGGRTRRRAASASSASIVGSTTSRCTASAIRQQRR